MPSRARRVIHAQNSSMERAKQESGAAKMGVHMRVAHWIALVLAAPMLAQQYDIVLANGRVMDPESNLDAVRNVGIRGGRIAAVSTSTLEGRMVVDVKGQVITAGFIDLHSHGQTPENYAFKARD